MKIPRIHENSPNSWKLHRIHENAQNSWKRAEFMKVRLIHESAPNSWKCAEFMKVRRIEEQKNTQSSLIYKKFINIQKVHEDMQDK